MDQLVNVLLAIDIAHTVSWKALHCEADLVVLNQVDGSDSFTPSAQGSCGKYNIFTRCTYRNHLYILMTTVVNVRKGQTYMPCKGEHKHSNIVY